MARRASSTISVSLILAGVILAIFVGILGFAASNFLREPFRTVQKLESRDLLEHASTLIGNTYRIRGQIDLLLSEDDNGNRIYSVLVDDGNQTQPLPLLMISKNSAEGFQKGQTFHFKVLVRKGGVLEVVDWMR